MKITAVAKRISNLRKNVLNVQRQSMFWGSEGTLKVTLLYNDLYRIPALSTTKAVFSCVSRILGPGKPIDPQRNSSNQLNPARKYTVESRTW